MAHDYISRRQLARVAYIAAFLAVQTLTDLFAQYPPLLWAGLAGLLVVFFDSVVCARRRLRVLRGTLADGESDPNC